MVNSWLTSPKELD